MTIANYSDLQTAVGVWLKRDDLTAYTADFITLAESGLEADLLALEQPPRFLETEVSGTMSSGLVTIPSDYAAMINFEVNSSSRNFALEYITPQKASGYTQSDKPRFYTSRGENFEILPNPDGSYSYTMRYYKKLPALSTGVNWLITNNPDLYLYATLLQAAPFLKDDKRIATWAEMYDYSLDNLKDITNRDRKSGSLLRVRAETYA